MSDDTPPEGFYTFHLARDWLDAHGFVPVVGGGYQGGRGFAAIKRDPAADPPYRIRLARAWDGLRDWP